MAFRSYRGISGKASWSLKVILISLQLIVLTWFLHRVLSLHTPAAIALFALSFAGAVLAIALGVWALIQIWNKGAAGAGRALLSIFFALLMLSGPAYFIPKYISLPSINDITTDFSAPPNFEVLAQKRSIWANSIIYPGDDFAEKQKAAYPHIRPMVLERSAREAFDLVRDAVRRLEWDIATRQEPGKDGASGWIEATSTTMIVGFVDDIVVRVSGDDAGARIDVRSSSRYGKHDFGRNAERVDLLFEEIRTGLAKGEQQLKLQQALQARLAEKRRIAEQKRREKAAELAKIKQEERARQRALNEARRRALQTEIDKKKVRQRRRRRKTDFDSLFPDL